ncbi:hypothetical protein TELCIR_03600 [Teladorsagia circumcincta]|uniref:Uncharacterized protein n=1 Tax=Teladorsagia circumcincta TaxID=45464 RepID=A0A2G9UW51_TELCI|nr:hypothetical protein TELCIR_03600 [Teladorsagia circumcincta]
MQVRPESAAQMTKEQKLTWGRLPPAAGFRSASAMGQPRPVLCSLAIFGIGVGRMLEGAKWAIGVELAYALLVMVAGLSGIYAVRQRSYAAATLVFCLTAFSAILAIPPFIMGEFNYVLQ